MSWLSPKRRKTTGNLKTIINGTIRDDDGSPTSNTNPNSPRVERPPSRPVSQPLSMGAGSVPEDGNLFYAYARRADDIKSRFLLTFASAAVANEWWSLVQANFPDSSRAGPQLFSFKQDDLLSRAWKHQTFAHLKTKWMFIQFGDAGNVGGAAQGIIPVQDAHGNMLGGAAPQPVRKNSGQVKKEVKSGKNEMTVLEEHFEKMMVAVEKNTETVAALAGRRGACENGSAHEGNGESYFDVPGLNTHLGHISDQLARNMESVEGLARKQEDNERRLVAALENSSKQRSDGVDLSKLSSHLDRIQKLMEKDVQGRRDSGKGMVAQQSPPAQIDFSPLTDKLDKVQQAIEQNSTLVQALLEKGSTSSTRGDEDAPQLDLSPLSSQLERIHSAIEQQSAHMQAFSTLTTGADEDGEEVETRIPLGGQLEDIKNAIEKGNTEAGKQRFDIAPLSKRLDALLKVQKESSQHKSDFSPLTEHLEAIRSATEQNAEQIAELVEAQRTSSTQGSSIDFTPLTDRLRNIHDTLQRQEAAHSEKAPGSGDSKFLLSALASHLSKIQAVTEQNAQHVRALRERQSASQEKMHTAIAQTAEQIRTMTRKNEDLGGREETRQAQMRELLSGQREMVEVMRELARGIKDRSGGACDHVVVPPPRKMGKKIVGFVYDAKDGSV